MEKEIEKLNKKKQLLDPNDDFKEYTVELLKKLDYQKEDDYLLFNKLGFSFMWDSLNRKAKRDILNKLVSQIEITRDKNYNIEIKNIKSKRGVKNPAYANNRKLSYSGSSTSKTWRK